jgi:hypothetical protein
LATSGAVAGQPLPLMALAERPVGDQLGVLNVPTARGGLDHDRAEQATADLLGGVEVRVVQVGARRVGDREGVGEPLPGQDRRLGDVGTPSAALGTVIPWKWTVVG